jgi:protein phosphatase
VKILIISDLHGNLEALTALPAHYDELWVLGDLVNYGPNPREVIDFVKKNASLVVRGNHDHALGFDTDPRCSKPYQVMAAEMGRITQALLSEKNKAFLRALPLSIMTETQGCRFHLCHAAPTDPLFAYCPPESSRWDEESRAVSPGYLLVGHTHLQFELERYGRKIINPGSVGQPKTGAPRAGFAIWEEGRLTLHSVPYDVERTAEKIRQLDISASAKEQLVEVLQNGALSDTTQSDADEKRTAGSAV